VASEANDRKRLKYSSLSASYCFIPVTVETLRTLGVDATDFMRQLGRRFATVTGDRRATDFMRQLGRRFATVTGDRRATEFLLQRLHVAIQRSHSAAVLGTVGSKANNLNAVFYI